jgi:hypothetical protein
MRLARQKLVRPSRFDFFFFFLETAGGVLTGDK